LRFLSFYDPPWFARDARDLPSRRSMNAR